MTIELWALVASAIWSLSLTGPITLGRSLTPGGVTWGMSNREEEPSFPHWVKRAERAHLNSLENLAPFIALITAVHLSNASGALSEVAAVTFVGARMAHSLCYLAGWTPWRTLTHIVGLGAQGALLTALII